MVHVEHGLAPRGQMAKSCQRFDVRCYGELQLMYRKGFATRTLRCQKAATGMHSRRKTLCQQPNH